MIRAILILAALALGGCPGVKVTDYAGATACDTDLYAAVARGLLARGVYPPPSQFEAWFVSTCHGDDEFARLAEALAGALEEAGA